MNSVAEALTGWTNEAAAGVPLADVFHIVNEATRQRVDNPAAPVIRCGHIVGLANHAVLIGRDGSERPIADSAAPILDDAGRMVGVVLVFRTSPNSVGRKRPSRNNVNGSRRRSRASAMRSSRRMCAGGSCS